MSFSYLVQNEKTEKNCLKFNLFVINPSDATTNMNVYSRDLKWEPLGGQEEIFPEGVRPVDEDILITKLAPSQKIEAILYAQKGCVKSYIIKSQTI